MKCENCNERDGDHEPYIGIRLCPECREEIFTKDQEMRDMTLNDDYATAG